MSTVTEIKKLKDMKSSSMLDYYVIIEDANGKFIKGYRFKGYSGSAVSDEIFSLKRQYPGHTVEMI